MTLTDPATLWRLILSTATQPADAARRLLALELRRDVLWMALVLVAVLNSLVTVLIYKLVPMPAPEMIARMSPLGLTALTAVLIAGLAVAVQMTGNVMGGVGTLSGALTAIVWLQFFWLVLEFAQLPFVLLGGGLVVSVLAMGLAIWALVQFVNVLHEFGSIAKSMVLLVLSFFGIGLVVTFMLTLTGVAVPGGGANV